MNIYLLATNLNGYNIKAMKQIAHSGMGIDLSSKLKDKLEPIRLVARMITGETEDRALKYAHCIMGHFYLTFILAIEPGATRYVIDMFDGFKLSLVEGKVNAWLISGTLDQWLNFLEYDNEISHAVQQILEKEGLDI